MEDIVSLRGETITITDDGEVEALNAGLDSSVTPDLKGWPSARPSGQQNRPSNERRKIIWIRRVVEYCLGQSL
jgi:hypothetical protein